MAAKVKSQSNGHSFITTGGEWVPPVGGTSVCAEIPGHYVGGTRKPGRFTSALAPMPQNPFLAEPRALTVPPPPDYSTAEAITERAQEGAWRGGCPSGKCGQCAWDKHVQTMRAVKAAVKSDGKVYREFQAALAKAGS